MVLAPCTDLRAIFFAVGIESVVEFRICAPYWAFCPMWHLAVLILGLATKALAMRFEGLELRRTGSARTGRRPSKSNDTLLYPTCTSKQSLLIHTVCHVDLALVLFGVGVALVVAFFEMPAKKHSFRRSCRNLGSMPISNILVIAMSNTLPFSVL